MTRSSKGNPSGTKVIYILACQPLTAALWFIYRSKEFIDACESLPTSRSCRWYTIDPTKLLCLARMTRTLQSYDDDSSAVRPQDVSPRLS